ncbi:MAG: hypothetical protein IPO93_05755 [Actinobacteria bacterium]|jgi:hypothetical protein|nr:hypothetical protein [Actinomycetota bacterium]
MKTTSESMTDRYVAAALKGVPEDQRTDVSAELRGSIADAVDARIDRGEGADVAERAVLTELGDPTRLAAEYAGRPLYLIGPAFYPDYARLLKVLLSIVVPVIAVVVGAATAMSGDDPWQVLISAASSAFSVGVQLAFWVTLVFALLERGGVQPRRSASSWDVSDLPALPDRRVGLGETIASIAGLALLIWFLIWQPGYRASLDQATAAVPILDPALSTFWIPFLVTVLLASITLEIVKYRKGRWTVPLAALNTVLSLAFAAPAIWLTTSAQLFNPAFLAATSGEALLSLVDLLPTLIAWIIAVVCVADITEGWWKALR